MVTSNEPKQRIGVTLTPAAVNIIRNLKADFNVVQERALQRIIEFFASLDFKMRAAILNDDPEARNRLLIEALHAMLGENAGSMDFESAAAGMKKLLDRMLELHRVSEKVAKVAAKTGRKS